MSHAVPDGTPSVRGKRKTQRQSIPSDPPVLLWSDKLIMTEHFLPMIRQTSIQFFRKVQKEQGRDEKRERVEV